MPVDDSAPARLARRALTALLPFLAASCNSPNPALYTMEVPPGAPHRGGPRVIELRAVSMARYLERSQIVRSSENFRLDILPNDWWGEPLDAMLGRVLARALTQRLPGSTVFVENGAISVEPEATLQVNVQRLDQDAARSIRLIAQFAIRRGASETRAITLQVPVRGATPADLVAGMSEAVGQLADQIATSLAAR